MRTYVILSNWTDQGIKNSHNTVKRAKTFRALIESRRGKLREHLYTLGEYDIITVAEFPDDATAAAAVLTLPRSATSAPRPCGPSPTRKRPRHCPTRLIMQRHLSHIDGLTCENAVPGERAVAG